MQDENLLSVEKLNKEILQSDYESFVETQILQLIKEAHLKDPQLNKEGKF